MCGRPFTVVEGDTFREMVKHFISIRATYGKVELDEVLPCSTTISRQLSGVVEVEKARLLQELEKVCQFDITTDLWSHDNTGHSYITIMVQYVAELQVQSKILATRVLDERHTAENIIHKMPRYRRDHRTMPLQISVRI